jgi:hypothetical protein
MLFAFLSLSFLACTASNSIIFVLLLKKWGKSENYGTTKNCIHAENIPSQNCMHASNAKLKLACMRNKITCMLIISHKTKNALKWQKLQKY